MEPTVSLAKQVQLLLPFSSMFNWTVWKMLWQKGTQGHVNTKLGDPPAAGRERLPGVLACNWGQECWQMPACWHGFGWHGEREELLPFSAFWSRKGLKWEGFTTDKHADERGGQTRRDLSASRRRLDSVRLMRNSPRVQEVHDGGSNE